MENRQASDTKETILSNVSRELYQLSEEDLAAFGLDEQMVALVSRLTQLAQEKRKHRQADGIAAAHARGVQFGRPPIKTPANFKQILEEYDTGQISLKTALRLCGMSTSTFCSRRREYLRMQAAESIDTNR